MKRSKGTTTTAPKKRRGKAKKGGGEETSPYFQNDAPPVGGEAGERLSRSFYSQDTVTLAQQLLGKVLCRRLPNSGEVLRGTVVETEAYPGAGDAASKSCKGTPTQSSMAMFMEPGTAYVYMTYGMYHCFNISANDTGGACLLRAVEVDQDYEVMHGFRHAKKKPSDKPPKRLKTHELCNGPAKLCLSFNINKDLDKVDMTSSDDFWMETSPEEKWRQREFEIEITRRVGIDSTPPEARDQPYRFFVKGSTSVSPVKLKEPKPKLGRGKGRKKKKIEEEESEEDD